jgi:hypothetical protein
MPEGNGSINCPRPNVSRLFLPAATAPRSLGLMTQSSRSCPFVRKWEGAIPLVASHPSTSKFWLRGWPSSPEQGLVRVGRTRGDWWIPFPSLAVRQARGSPTTTRPVFVAVRTVYATLCRLARSTAACPPLTDSQWPSNWLLARSRMSSCPPSLLLVELTPEISCSP